MRTARLASDEEMTAHYQECEAVGITLMYRPEWFSRVTEEWRRNPKGQWVCVDANYESYDPAYGSRGEE